MMRFYYKADVQQKAKILRKARRPGGVGGPARQPPLAGRAATMAPRPAAVPPLGV
jgi:hypothetical protein